MFVRLIREGRCGKSRRLSHLGSFYGADLFFVHNHLSTVHAIASCNAAEMAMGMLMEATVPTTHRWIPKAMSVSYLQKATTSLRATARIDPPDFHAITEGAELVVPISVVDRFGAEVVHADITTWVTPA
jgi:acyl-coenzyme A thioesterase PaaI-like protein